MPRRETTSQEDKGSEKAGYQSPQDKDRWTPPPPQKKQGDEGQKKK